VAGDLFETYGSPAFEIRVVAKWIENYILDEIIKRYNNLIGYKICKNLNFNANYDVEVVFEMRDQKVITIKIEVKTEEDRWYSQTNNIGLDYISAFKFRDKAYKNKIKNQGNWVSPEELNEFKRNITVKRDGKLYTCDADIQLFYCKLNETEAKFFAYCNECLKNLRTYFENHYPLRINDKASYDLNDTWESAAYFVNPEECPELKKCEINSLDKLIECLNWAKRMI
jgi:hypothetical protein